MRKLSKAAVLGLTMLAFATAAFAGSGIITRSIPEPAVFALTGVGLILLGLMRRSRSKN